MASVNTLIRLSLSPVVFFFFLVSLLLSERTLFFWERTREHRHSWSMWLSSFSLS